MTKNRTDNKTARPIEISDSQQLCNEDGLTFAETAITILILGIIAVAAIFFYSSQIR